MPPKAKYTKEQIVSVAFEMTREKGFELVSARELGKALGTSVAPIFNIFENMNDLKNEVKKRAMKEFESYVGDIMAYTPAFKRFGMQMIAFAKTEPQLFRLLFMDVNEQSQSFDELMGELGNGVVICLEIIQKEHKVDEKQAKILFEQAWIQSFSICVLLVNKICSFTEEEIANIISINFQGTLFLLKSGKFQKIDVEKK